MDLRISFKPGHTKSGTSGEFFRVYSSAKTSKEYFQLHPGTSGRQNADWRYDMKGNTKGPIFFFHDPKLRDLQRQETGFFTREDDEEMLDVEVEDSCFLVDASPLFSFDQISTWQPPPRDDEKMFSMRDYIETLPEVEPTAPDDEMPDLAEASDSDDDSDDENDDHQPNRNHKAAARSTPKSRPPTREKFYQALERLEQKYIEQQAELFNITEDEYCDIREMNYFMGSKEERSFGKNTDLDEEIFDSLMYHHMSGGVEEIYLGFDTPTQADPNQFEYHQEKIADLKNIPESERPKTFESIVREITDLAKNGTFAIVQLPQGRKAIKTKWVLKIKLRADGKYDKHKARLVAKGFLQKIGIDYFATFSPMATMTATRLVLAIATHLGLDIHHSDIPLAFVRAATDADLWIELPPGVEYVDRKTGLHTRILKLLKGLYGLKQSALNWSRLLHQFLIDLGYAQAAKDQCIYYIDSPTGFVIIATAVDDLIITGSDTDAIEKLRLALVEKWEITQWEKLESYLGMHVEYDMKRGMLEMNMTKKIEDLLFKLHPTLGELINGNAKMPMKSTYSFIVEGKHKPTAVESYIKDNYPSIVGSLIFIMISVRPDICTAVGCLSRAMHKPEAMQTAMAVDVLSYLKRTAKMKLVYRRSGNAIEELLHGLGKDNVQLCSLMARDPAERMPLVSFSDANFAPKTEPEYQSTTGYAMYALCCLICYKSKV